MEYHAYSIVGARRIKPSRIEDHDAICLWNKCEHPVTSESNQPNILDLARYTPYATIKQMPRLFRLLLALSKLSSSLSNHSLLLSLTGSLGLRALGIHLLLQDSLTGFLSLGSVDLRVNVSQEVTAAIIF